MRAEPARRGPEATGSVGRTSVDRAIARPAVIARTEEALARVLAMEHPADAVLARYFREHPRLGVRDRAFVAEAVYAALRHARFLDAAGAVSPRSRVLAAAFRFGGFKLRELEPLTEEERRWLAGLKGLRYESLPLPVQAELPDWLWARLAAAYGEAQALALGRSMQHPAPLDLRVNSLRAQRHSVLQALAEEGIQAVPTPYSPVGIRVRGKPSLQHSPLFLTGALEVQDEGSQLLAYLVSPRRGEMVVDFCAGAGGKTLHLGALMGSEGRVYAFDVADRRLARLRFRLKRSGLSNVYPQRIDSENDARVRRLAGKIDRVLVDAPCSGSGTLRRNPDLKWRQSPATVAALVRVQTSLLDAAARLVKPGGRLVYATCSLLTEENEAVVEAFLSRSPAFSLVPASEVLARHDIIIGTGPWLRLLPHVHGTDGFFAAVLERTRAAS